MDQDESVGSACSQRVGRCTGTADNGYCALSGESLDQFSFGSDFEDVASGGRRMGHDIDGAVAEARCVAVHCFRPVSARRAVGAPVDSVPAAFSGARIRPTVTVTRPWLMSGVSISARRQHVESAPLP